MILKKAVITILSVILVLISSFPAYAHGVIYDMKPLDDKTVRITLKWSEQAEEQGIVITHFYLKNGKTLNIGYEVKKGMPPSCYFDFNITSAITPIRINLTRLNDKNFNIFKDINGIEAEEYIRHLHDAGIVNGNPDGTFKPESRISRAEFAVLIVKALNLKGEVSNNEFTDINKNWAKNYILIAAKHGLLTGYKDKTFRPDNPITVAEACSIISKAFTFKTAKNGIYSKLKTDMWYSSHVKKLFDKGILKVTDSIYENFNEEKYISRADCAMIISRAISTY